MVLLSLYLCCVKTDGAAHLLGCLICRWLPAAIGTWHMPPSQYVLLVSVGGATHLLGYLICRWLLAVRGTWRMPPSQDVLRVFSRRWFLHFHFLALTISEVVACTSGTWR